ncbi:amidohydrolase family protein [Novosphingobium sp.]|uniref:amidohydrolase family protein n=1 Tax=Novosphingobium sp. TaxID=1874826 RepID=UPI0025D56B2E|nr:amidohydrolase family protein [Novosphingobium sp.]
MTLIIDCHGHYTVLPKAHDDWRETQKAAFKAGTECPLYPQISDDAIRETIEANQLRLIRERGADMTIFSPRASAMAPHVGDQSVAVNWAQACNDLIGRVAELYPDTFAPVCMLPQSPEADMSSSIAELRRCVGQMGFIGCNLNPDPGGGHFQHPALTDPFWFPFYEAMVELDVPAMIHVSGSCNPAMHATGAYYIAADTIAFMQLLEGDLFARYPTLRFIIPHGGGAVPYHWGRYRGLADMLKKPDLSGHLMNNVFFDTCVYHQPGINLLADVIDTKNILFGSEMVGAVRGIDPTTGFHFDDTKRYVDALAITDGERHAIYEGNARRVFPRLDAQLKERGK